MRSITGSVRSAVTPESPTGQPVPRLFSLDDTARLGLSRRLTMCSQLFALGSSASSIVGSFAQLLNRELGTCPQSISYLMVDSATPTADVVDPLHANRHLHVGKQIDGCGSDPHLGEEVFRDNYSRIWNKVESHVLKLDPHDPLLPANVPPRQAVEFWLFAGCGGTSGGMLDQAILLLNDVARSLHINEPRVNVVLIGADLPRLDVTRTLAMEQRLVLPETLVTNLGSCLHDFLRSATRWEQPPGRPEFSQPTSRRVWSLSLVDYTNREHDLTKMSELIEMTALGCFNAIVTPLGKSVNDRYCDLDRLGVTGRGEW